VKLGMRSPCRSVLGKLGGRANPPGRRDFDKGAKTCLQGCNDVR
jgi:hypothetical protein